MRRLIAAFYILVAFVSVSMAQTNEVMRFGESEGLSHRHVTQILQDKDGFIWLATWNGLNRFDGREFVTFKSRPGDGVDMPSDRFRNIAIDDHNPNIINCRVDDYWFRFSLLNGKFHSVDEATNKALMQHPGHGQGKFIKGGDSNRFQFYDRQGLLWNVLNDGISITYTFPHPITAQHWDKKAEVKAISADSIGRIWVASKEDKTIRIYDHGIVRYLTSDGTITSTPVAFGYSVYCICTQSNGDIYLGSKPDGIFKLHREGSGYKVTHIAKGNGGLPAGDIYDIKADASNRLWIATMDAGLICYDKGHYQAIRFGRENKARHIYIISNNVLVATTTEGLLVVDITPGHKLKWRLHRREANRAESLSNNACMDFTGIGGKWLVSTESGGINEILGNDLTAERLSFKHFDEDTGLGSDVILSIVPFVSSKGNSLYGNYSIIAVSNNSLILFNPETGESRELSSQLFHQQLSFSDARPCHSNGVWYFGLNDGLAMMEDGVFSDDGTFFPIVLTSLTIENQNPDYIVNQLKEVKLNSHERTVTVSFAELDYRNPKNIRYAYRVQGDADWHYLGNSNTVRLSELAPGEYTLELRATNALGKWNPKIRSLKITVEPKFTETVWFQLLLLLIFGGLAFAFVWTRRYIRNIQRKQKETLEAYLALLEKNSKVDETANSIESEPSKEAIATTSAEAKATSAEAKEGNDEQTKATNSSTQLSPEDDAFMSRVVSFIEEHIMDSEINVDDMASAAAVSRSSLNRKMKMLVGVTPADFLREARIKRACSLLATTKMAISDIAYRCGFSDPKYFSRTFRQSTGMTPTDYRSKEHE